MLEEYANNKMSISTFSRQEIMGLLIAATIDFSHYLQDEFYKKFDNKKVADIDEQTFQEIY